MRNPIRTYAASSGHEIVGKLSRTSIKGCCSESGASIPYIKGDKLYMDEAGNEYWLTKQGEVCIVTCNGDVI